MNLTPSDPPSDARADLRARSEAASAHLPGLILAAERLAAQVVPGAHGLRRAGPGEDFWQYRPAASGDGLRSIDWRRSARSDQQFVRDREAQTAHSAAIWVSAGQGMGFSGGPDRPTKSDRARLLGLALSMLLLRGGEKVGLLGQPARAGRNQADRLAEALATAPLQEVEADAPAPGALRPNARVILIGDYLAEPDWLTGFLAQATGLGVSGVILQVLDPDEEQFPYQGAAIFRSMGGGMRHDSRDAGGLRGAYLARLAARRDWLRAQAGQAGWQFGHARTDTAPGDTLNWLWRALEG